MRRKDREVTHFPTIISVIDSCKVCRLAMVDGGRPYVVPLNFGFTANDDGTVTLYFHGAMEGRKLDVLKKYPEVCFEMDSPGHLLETPEPCSYGFAFVSVIGEGTVEFISGHQDKSFALNRIMLHQAGKEFVFPRAMTDKVCVFSVTSRSLTCKARPE